MRLLKKSHEIVDKISMEIVPRIPLIWAKQIRDAGMVKNQALKILKESSINAEQMRESISRSAPGPRSETPQQQSRKLDIV